MSSIIFVKIKITESYASYFHFFIKNSFLRKNENKRYNLSNGLDLDKYYSKHDQEQYSRGFNRRSDILRNANAGGTMTFNPYNSKNIL